MSLIPKIDSLVIRLYEKINITVSLECYLGNVTIPKNPQNIIDLYFDN